MNSDSFTWDQGSIRGTDTNSLLRLYDLAKGILNTSGSQQERARAGRASQRIAKELRKRNVPL
jgi:hypothetical protein